MTFTQSNRNLTRQERALVNCMVHEEYENPEINRELVSLQACRELPLRLMSDGYLDRVRSQFRQFRHAADNGQEEAAQYGIDMLEAGYSWSGTDATTVCRLRPAMARELRKGYLDENNEATR